MKSRNKKSNGYQYSYKEQEPLIENKSAEAVRFEIPEAPTFSKFGSILSILSLMLMSGLSIYMFLELEGESAWIRAPFLFTILGGTLGWVFELGLLLAGTPFLLLRNKFTIFIQKLRFLNIAPVVATLFLFVTTIVITQPDMRIAILFLVVFSCVALAIASYYGGFGALPLVILGIQITQFIIVLASGIPVGGMTVKYMLLGQAALQATAFIVGTATPMKSTGFHVISTASGLLAFFAISHVLKVDPEFGERVAYHIPKGSLIMWGLIVAGLAGLMFIMKSSPMTYNNWRAGASNAIWSVQYFLLIGAPRFPKPLNLTDVYKNGKPEPSKLQPYYLQHPEFLPEMLSIPAVERIEGNVTAFGKLVVKVKKTFKIIALMDHFFPQADVNIPLKEKPRMKIWSNGADIFPKLFHRKLFGFSLPVPDIKPTPKPAVEAFKKGQLLAYLGEYGIANPFLKPAKNKEDGTLVMDFRFLEKYETKADYESYGGLAYFKANTKKERLELISVVAPKTTDEILVDPIDPTFRHAESMILASMYFQVISGKHLAEIHMSYNLLEVVLHNAFDAQGQFGHPFRTFMYLHLFSHELAEELTTEHLVQDGAVFNQVFATTHSSLVNHLNDCYHSMEYGEDEDFEARLAAMTMDNGKVLPNACINWEMKYAEIWRKYTDDLIDIIYKDDTAVQNDQYLQDVHKGLNQVFIQGLPARYDNFQTKKGVSRWASDTIHHLVVRHQVYGTTGINAAMDPRISVTQVPKDRGTQGVDEWRSLMCVGLATACARFTLLIGSEGESFTYLLDHLDDNIRVPMSEVFIELQEKLLDLDKEWTADTFEKDFNRDYFRAAPSDMRTGPGY